MKEFMLLIRNLGDAKVGMPAEREQQFLKACEVYIRQLTEGGNLVSAQPLVREGTMLSGTEGAWKEGPYTESKEIIVGYYHLRAGSLEEAIALAKGNPEFAYSSSAKIEVRPIKTKEVSTGFTYPNEG